MMIHEFARLDSTQTKAKELIESKSAAIGDVVWAHEQLAGRGRGNHQWHAQAGSSLTCTFIAPSISHGQPPLSLVVGALLAQAFSQLDTNTESIKIKWPNDLYYQGKKLGGILIENTQNYSLIGIGINIKYTESLEHLEATALDKVYTSPLINISSILEEVTQALSPILTNFDNLSTIWKPCHTYIESNQLYLNQLVMLNSGNEQIQGVIKGINEQGALLVATKNTEQEKGLRTIIQASMIRPVTG